MRLIFLLSFIFLVAPICVTAQNPEEYHLRTIPPESFMNAIPDLITLDLERNTSGFADDISTEMQLRYGDISQVSDVEINRAYQSLKSTDSFVRIDRAYWNQQLIMSHINGARLKLQDGDTYYWFGTHLIKIEERDFNADGQPEFILHVDSSEYRQMLVLEAVSHNRYRLVPAPLPWFAYGQPYFSTLSGGLEEILFYDILNDGSPEWVLALGGIQANHKQFGRLLILKWHNGQLVDVATPEDRYNGKDGLNYAGVGAGYSIHPDYVNWYSRNLDNDPANEIQQVQEYTDNWSCTFIENRTFDWNADAFSYQFLNTDRVYEESAGCNLRRAQEAMWDGDIEGAIELYEASQRQADDLSDLHTQYLDLRLALAYRLIGEHSKADALLQNLQTQPPSSEFMAVLIERVTSAYARLPTALNLCQAMYNQFAEGFTFYQWEAQNLGTINDVPVPNTSIEAPRVNPIRAGCDFPGRLENYVYTVSVPLSGPLEVEPKHMITADFDNDDIDEHLIWFSENREFFPYLLTINGISRPPIPFPDENTVLITETLDTGEIMLVYKFYRDDVIVPDEFTFHTDQFYWYTCYPLQDRGNSLERERGYLRLWRLNGSELVTTLDMPLCEDISTNSVLNRDDISGWAIIDETSAVEANYEWNDETDRYEIVSLNTEAIPENSVNNNQNTPSISYAIYRSKREYQDTGNWFWGILRMQRALEANPDDTSEHVRLHYCLGFFYEMAGNESRAVEHYLAAATDGSGTSWGELAALHLTPEP